MKLNIKLALTASLIAFVLTFPILGITLKLESGKLIIGPNYSHAFYAAVAVFLMQLIFPVIQEYLKKISIHHHPIKKTKEFIEYKKAWVLLITFILICIFPFIVDRGTTDVFTLAVIYILLGLGLNVVVGFAGLLDLGYVGFYAVGSYTYALLAQGFGFGFWEALPVAGLFAGIMGIILGFPVLRLRGDYLAIVTLGFGEIIRILLNNLDSWTGGPDGIGGIPKPTLFGLEFARRSKEGKTFHEFFGIDFASEHRVIFLFFTGVLLVIITLFIINRLIRMPIGRAWEALREDEIACRSLGLNPTSIKLSAFAIGATLAGFSGAFFAAKQGFINPESFTFIESAIVLAIVVLGGMGSQLGVIFAAIILTVLPELARGFDNYRMLIFGLVMVLMMIWRPQGLVPATRPKIKLSAIKQGK